MGITCLAQDAAENLDSIRVRLFHIPEYVFWNILESVALMESTRVTLKGVEVKKRKGTCLILVI